MLSKFRESLFSQTLVKIFFPTLFGNRSHPERDDVNLEPPVQVPKYMACHKSNAIILSIVTTVLLLISIFLNIWEGNTALIKPLLCALLIPALSIIWLITQGNGERFILFSLSSSLFLLGLYLLFKQMAPDASSFYWFIIFPPMVMLGLGLKVGTCIFCVFYVILVYTLLSSLHKELLPFLSDAARIRFLLAMLGAFIFSWCAEYLRSKTHEALLQAMQHLEEQALTDPLTGLGNRRSFDSSLSWLMAKSKRDNGSFALALIDIDHFKSINDCYGHDVGDMILRHIAISLAAEMRATDKIFRWGGEEFVLLMSDTGLNAARMVAHRIRRHVEKTPFTYRGAPIFCTVSIGLYAGSGEKGAAPPLFQADKHLYIAKNSGRNRVVG